MESKSFKATVEFDDQPRHVVSAFSVFNTLDSDGDVVLPSFFRDQQPVAMSSWGHRWDNLPPGKGIIRVHPDVAVFDGHFLNTATGEEHYQTVKQLAELQEWSFGFRVLESYLGDFQGQQVRYLKEGEIFEVSPVLIGANRLTQTLAIKSGLSYQDEAETVLAAVNALIGRSGSLADLRAKEGRTLSEANRQRLRSLQESISALAAEIDELLESTGPVATSAVSEGADPEVRALFDRFSKLDNLYSVSTQ